MKRILALIITFTFIFSAVSCSKPQSDAPKEETESTEATEPIVPKAESEMFTDRDSKKEYDTQNAVTVTLGGNSAQSSSDSVKISGTDITLTKEATYVFSGTLSDGRIIVDANDTAKLQIVFNGANITSAKSAPLYVIEGDKVFITLEEGTQNSLVNGGEFEQSDEGVDAAVFSKQDITFNGNGALTVTSPAGHGIVSKDDLVFTGGSFEISCASHGIDANDSIRIKDSTFDIVSGKDGIHAENNDDTALGYVYVSSGNFNIDAQGDGISAGAYAQLCGGEFNIVTGGGSTNAQKQTSDSWGGFMGGKGGMGMRPTSSASQALETDDSSTSIKGIKAASGIIITGGKYVIDSADDAIHSNADITISDGAFELSSGDDGIHADSALTVESGSINIKTCYEGLEALELKVSGSDISLIATDDGFNAAGGTDGSGFGGFRQNDTFGGRGPGGVGGGAPGGMGGSSASSGSIEISGGSIYINSSGDGLDANGTLTISGGYTTVCGPTKGDTATLDYDQSGIITGGTFIGTGASGMAQTFSDAKQGVISVSVGNQPSGTQIKLTDKSGNVILTVAPELSYEIAILSSPEIVSGDTYTLTVGTESADFQAK